jgi:hypothetical protein
VPERPDGANQVPDLLPGCSTALRMSTWG